MDTSLDTSLERRSLILGEVYLERSKQIKQGYTLKHDLDVGPSHLIMEVANNVYVTIKENDYTRQTLVECAALLVAALEVIDTTENN